MNFKLSYFQDCVLACLVLLLAGGAAKAQLLTPWPDYDANARDLSTILGNELNNSYAMNSFFAVTDDGDSAKFSPGEDFNFPAASASSAGIAAGAVDPGSPGAAAPEAQQMVQGVVNPGEDSLPTMDTLRSLVSGVFSDYQPAAFSLSDGDGSLEGVDGGTGADDSAGPLSDVNAMAAVTPALSQASDLNLGKLPAFCAAVIGASAAVGVVALRRRRSTRKKNRPSPVLRKLAEDIGRG